MVEEVKIINDSIEWLSKKGLQKEDKDCQLIY